MNKTVKKTNHIPFPVAGAIFTD